MIYISYRAFAVLRIYLIIVGLFFICACSGGTVVGNPESTENCNVLPDIRTFVDAGELEAYIKDQYASRILTYSTLGYLVDKVGIADFEVNMESVDVLTKRLETDMSEQEVEASDKVKYDETYLYVAGERGVNIVRAVPAEEMVQLSKIDVEGQILSLYLYHDILVILYVPDDGEGSAWEGTALNELGERIDIGIPYWTPVNARTGLLLVDIGNPVYPERIKQMVLDGFYASSRLINGKLHIVQQFLPDLPTISLWYDGTEEDRNRVIVANKQKLDMLSLNELLPHRYMIDSMGNPTDVELLVRPENLYCPADPSGGSLVTITAISLNDLSENVQTKGIVADIHQIHASVKSLYLSETQWHYSSDSASEKDLQSTSIHKFDLTGKDMVYIGTASVKGRISTPQAMNDYGDVLRIATTSWDVQSETAQNNLFCLSMEDDKLSIAGRLENIEPGKKMYSACFIDNRGFLIFSGNLSPIKTVDLSIPSQPRIAGDLNVHGENVCLYTLGKGHLIALGKNLEEIEGVPYDQGIRLSIFDISNLSQPERVDSIQMVNSSIASDVFSYNYAFAYDLEKNLISIPVVTKQPDGDSTNMEIHLFKITEEYNFEQLGRIDVGSMRSDIDWFKGIFMDDNIYAVSNSSIISAIVDDIRTIVSEVILDDK